MEPERVGSFGCRPQRKLSKLMLNLSRSSTTTSASSKKSLSSDNLTSSPITPKSPIVSSSSRRRTSSITSKKSPPSSNYLTSSPKTPKSPIVSSSSARRTSSVRSREDDYKAVFGRFDKDKDGKISAVELRLYFGSVGEYISHEDAEAVIAHLDTDGDNLIDFLDFMRLMNPKEKQDDDEDLKKAFEMFEMEKGSGNITPKSLQRVLSRLGEVKTYDECVIMIQVYDTDGKGELRFHDFQQMMLA